MTTFVTIRQRYEGLKAFLLPGIENLQPSEIVLASQACQDLLTAIPLVSLTFDLEDDRRVILSQIKIIKRILDQLYVPSYATSQYYPMNTSLYQIAADVLGDAQRWNDIAVLNGIDDPYLTQMTLINLPVR